MLPAIRAEARKLLTIRSTYILSGIAFLLVAFLTFWIFGYKAPGEGSHVLIEAVSTGGSAISVFMAIIGILLITHEYRYNTIMYTLTASNSRSKVLAAKILVFGGFVAAFTVFIMLASALFSWIGLQMGHERVVAQEFFYWDTIWRTLTYVLFYTLAGLMFGVLFRHVVGAIAVFMIVPSTIEGLLSMLLKENTKYLPFTALEQINSASMLKPATAALIFGAYLAGGWIIAWFLFLKRDAN